MRRPADGTIVIETFADGTSVDYRIVGEVPQNDPSKWYVDIVVLGGAVGDERMLERADFEPPLGRFAVKSASRE